MQRRRLQQLIHDITYCLYHSARSAEPCWVSIMLSTEALVSWAVAEVPSTFAEMIVTDRLLAAADGRTLDGIGVDPESQRGTAP